MAVIQSAHYIPAPEWLETPEGRMPRDGDPVVRWHDSLGGGAMALTGCRYVEARDGTATIVFDPPPAKPYPRSGGPGD